MSFVYIISTNSLKCLARRFYKFPHYIETTTFGISCDAYTNLKETLTRHKTMVAEYLDKNYDRVCLSLLALHLSIELNHFVMNRSSSRHSSL